jgi:hypothetical protein
MVGGGTHLENRDLNLFRHQSEAFIADLRSIFELP